MLIRIYTKLFKFLVGLCCWLFLFGGFFCGMGIGGYINTAYMGGNAGYMSILCAIVGFLAVLFSEIMFIAPLMILFTLDSRIKNIDQTLNGPDSLN